MQSQPNRAIGPSRVISVDFAALVHKSWNMATTWTNRSRCLWKRVSCLSHERHPWSWRVKAVKGSSKKYSFPREPSARPHAEMYKLANLSLNSWTSARLNRHLHFFGCYESKIWPRWLMFLNPEVPIFCSQKSITWTWLRIACTIFLKAPSNSQPPTNSVSFHPIGPNQSLGRMKKLQKNEKTQTKQRHVLVGSAWLLYFANVAPNSKASHFIAPTSLLFSVHS